MLTQHYLSFLVIFLGDNRFIVLQLLSLTKWIFIQIQSSMTIFHHKLLTREGRVLANRWTHAASMTIFVNLFIRSVIYKVTIVTINTIWHIIFSVVFVTRNRKITIGSHLLSPWMVRLIYIYLYVTFAARYHFACTWNLIYIDYGI